MRGSVGAWGGSSPGLPDLDYLYCPPDRLPLVLAPPPDAPIVAVIDSGIRSAHPLLAPAVVGAETVGPGLGDGGDEHGHGTLVASLALHGPLEHALADRAPLRPAGRLLGIRVLNERNEFPDTTLWEVHLLNAIRLAADAGARVVNLSLGDDRHPYRPPRPTPLAAAIDTAARQHDLVVVVSAGNYPRARYTAGPAMAGEYPVQLLTDPAAGLVDPASAAVAITVGALCGDAGQGVRPARDRVEVVPLGEPDFPSPLTRRGPGAMGMVKPEVATPGGSFAIDELTGSFVDDPSLLVVGAGGELPERLLARAAGTSYAAPLVSHIALRVLARYPRLSANAVRALVLASAQPLSPVVAGGGTAGDAAEQRRLSGYGRPSAPLAEASHDHRAVLVAEAEITVDDVHLYTVQLPATFFHSGGTRTLTVTLAYDPPVRPSRLDYLASRMLVRAYRGVPLDTVRDAYVQQLEAAPQDPPDGSAEALTPASLRDYELQLQPADRYRGLGAHQLGSRTFQQRLTRDRGAAVVLAVRNTNRWDIPGTRQPYALVVVLERDTDHAPLYAELRARLEVLVEAEAEIQ